MFLPHQRRDAPIASTSVSFIKESPLTLLGQWTFLKSMKKQLRAYLNCFDLHLNALLH